MGRTIQRVIPSANRIARLIGAWLPIALSALGSGGPGLETRAAPTTDTVLRAAEAAMGSNMARAGIHSIYAVASCHGPHGKYRTRILSDRKGNLFLEQTFPDHKTVEGILDGKGWELDNTGKAESIDAIELSVLRAHEFPMIALDLRNRFRDLEVTSKAQFEGQTAIQVEMTDDFGHSLKAYFSPLTHLLVGIVSTNAQTGKPITTRFDEWKLIHQVRLVSHVTISYEAETWVFDFKVLNLNKANKEAFQIPECPTGRRNH